MPGLIVVGHLCFFGGKKHGERKHPNSETILLYLIRRVKFIGFKQRWSIALFRVVLQI